MITYKRFHEKEDLDNLLKETGKLQGDSFLIQEDAIPYLKGLSGYYSFGAYQDERLVGAIFGRYLNPEELGYYIRFVRDFITSDVLDDFLNRRGGVINVFVADKSLDTDTLTEVTRELQERVIQVLHQVAPVIFVDLLHEPGDVLYEARLQDFRNKKFEIFEEIPEFWLEHTKENPETKCPHCGNPCHCAATVLYHRS